MERGSLNFKTVLAPLGVTRTLVRSSAGPLLSPGLCGSQGATEQGAGVEVTPGDSWACKLHMKSDLESPILYLKVQGHELSG